MKKLVKMLALVLAISAACQAVIAYAAGNKEKNRDFMVKESPGP